VSRYVSLCQTSGAVLPGMFPTTYRGELQDTLSLFIVAGDAGPLIAILAMRLQISLLDAFSGITMTWSPSSWMCPRPAAVG